MRSRLNNTSKKLRTSKGKVLAKDWEQAVAIWYNPATTAGVDKVILHHYHWLHPQDCLWLNGACKFWWMVIMTF